MDRDLYEILGVPRTASADDLKKAHRTLVRKFHPDVNKEPGAAGRFKEIQEAYDILADDEKRKRYDQFGHAGLEGPQGGGQGFQSAEDVFAAFGEMFGGGGGGFFEQFFGGGRRGRGRRGASLKVDLELTLEEVASGVKRTIEIKRPVPCEKCGGNGCKAGSKPSKCKTCAGHGRVVRQQGFFQVQQACPTCEGAGQRIDDPCTACKGRGAIPQSVPLQLTIPPGVESGHTERIAGQGEPGDGGGPAGDLVVVLHVKEHEVFTRYGDDLLMQSRITFRQAVSGDEIEIPTITGEAVTMQIPAGTQPGEKLRVRNHGLPRGDGYGRGNLVVQVQVDVPKKVTEEQAELLRKFDELDGRKGRKNGKKTIFEKVKDIFS